MTESELYLELNTLVSRFLEDGGDPSILAETLREFADDVFEEDEEDDNFDPDRRGGPGWISG
jgi:hypothetical protein